MTEQRRKHVYNYKIAACFDIETSNNENLEAQPVCYQFSKLRDPLKPIADLKNDNVRDALNVFIDRDYSQVFARFDDLMAKYAPLSVVPVVMVHNLSFELWVISAYISKFKNVVGCSKSCVKPLTIVIRNADDSPALVFWDTLSFSGKSLATLGDECGYPKLLGSWDYLKKRTTATTLTPEEEAYAIEDVIVPFAWFSYYLNMEGIDENRLACKILTKTSAVRSKVEHAFGTKRLAQNCSVSREWSKRNAQEVPKSDEELFTIHAGTRGGATYCASSYASRVFKNDGVHKIFKFDACSMHIFHALAHYVPSQYREVSPQKARELFEFVTSRSVADLLENYAKPFAGANFYGVFDFKNLRMKEGSIFKRDGISNFASSRFKICKVAEQIEENQAGVEFNEHIFNLGFHDQASDDAIFAFGKFFGASWARLYLNELSAWELGQMFEWDSVAVSGQCWATGKLSEPTRRSILAFNEMYKNKSLFKIAKHQYEHGEEVNDYHFIPRYLYKRMAAHDPNSRQDVELFYLSKKADLNSLYGIEATNEAKPEILLDPISGYSVSECQGVEALPQRPKTWFQYGSHIVGWSRIHQLIFMSLIAEKTDAIFINGDTDSHKIYTTATLEEIEDALAPLHKACACTIDLMASKTPEWYEWYPMNGLGFYECEGEPREFCAAWNKCYAELGEDGRIDITLAGVPCDKRFTMPDGSIVDHSYNRIANYLFENGKTFEEIANLMISYNISISSNVTGMNQRTLPKWNTFGADGQPCAVHLAPMTKTIGDTNKALNFTNSTYAQENNPNVNITPKLIDWPLDVDEPVIVNI